MQGDAGRSDMSNLEFDRGPNILDQRHTFIGSIVAQPTFSVDGVMGAILNHNQFGFALQFASGIPVNVRSNRELVNDATASDRPLGVARNSLSLPARKNVDMRYARKFPIRSTVDVQFTVEVKNLFNTVQWAGVNSTVVTDTLGVPASTIPRQRQRVCGDERLRAAAGAAGAQGDVLERLSAFGYRCFARTRRHGPERCTTVRCPFRPVLSSVCGQLDLESRR